MNVNSDPFLIKLNQLLDKVSPDKRTEMFVRAGEMDARMRRNGQDRPEWHCKLSESEILGKEVVVKTEAGERVGTVVCFGIHQDGAMFERSVYVLNHASGSIHEAPGSETRLASSPDIERISREISMAQTLEKHENSSGDNKKIKRRGKTQYDPALTQKLLDIVAELGLPVEELKTFYKIEGNIQGRKLYLSTSSLTANLAGYSVDHPAIRKISSEEAKEQHLGAVRGTILFDDHELAIEAFIEALGGLI